MRSRNRDCFWEGAEFRYEFRDSLRRKVDCLRPNLIVLRHYFLRLVFCRLFLEIVFEPVFLRRLFLEIVFRAVDLSRLFFEIVFRTLELGRLFPQIVFGGVVLQRLFQ